MHDAFLNTSVAAENPRKTAKYQINQQNVSVYPNFAPIRLHFNLRSPASRKPVPRLLSHHIAEFGCCEQKSPADEISARNQTVTLSPPRMVELFLPLNTVRESETVDCVHVFISSSMLNWLQQRDGQDDVCTSFQRHACNSALENIKS